MSLQIGRHHITIDTLKPVFWAGPTVFCGPRSNQVVFHSVPTNGCGQPHQTPVLGLLQDRVNGPARTGADRLRFQSSLELNSNGEHTAHDAG